MPSPNKKENIWYKNYMVLIFVIGLPVFVIIVCLFFIFYSIKIQDSTVRDDWYMDGKTLYQDASRDQLSYDLDLSGIMRFDGKTVRFELRYPAESLASGKLKDGSPLTYPKQLSVRISHATDINKDKDFVITHTQDNLYQGTVELDNTPAKYYLQVSHDQQPNWRLIQTQKLPAANISFQPLSSFAESRSALPDQKDKRASHKQ